MIYLADPDVTLHQGDVLDCLAELPDGSVDCVVTSPPYWGLRDYGVVDQIGLEETPDAYLARMVAVFREVRRVLAPHGTCWVNMGDGYAAAQGGRQSAAGEMPLQTKRTSNEPWNGQRGDTSKVLTTRDVGLKPKDLIGMPWRLALALQADGWWLRADIIWSKPNPMPESVTDRPTKSHEYVFLLTKQARYFYDADAVREPLQESTIDRGYTTIKSSNGPGKKYTNYPDLSWTEQPWTIPAGRNLRTVWTIPTQPFKGSHFATFPERLPELCILAGCPERVCTTCGKPSERIVDVSYDAEGRTTNGPRSTGRRHETAGFEQRKVKSTSTVGFTDCGHGTWRPGIVLDPFAGSGTTLHVARKHGRHSVGIELNPDSCELAAKRLAQLSLLAISEEG